jgi:hypothetical protein
MRGCAWLSRRNAEVDAAGRLAGETSAPRCRILIRGAWCAIVLATLAACAGSIAPPTTIVDLPQGQKASLQVSNISADGAPGVVITPDDLDRIVLLVTAEIRASSPETLAVSDPSQAKLMKITISRYDEGNAFARFMLAGLGQIYIDGDVVLLDGQTKQVVAEYKVPKDFAFGGLYGGSTTIRDVEKGFARSVAAAIKPKT